MDLTVPTQAPDKSTSEDVQELSAYRNIPDIRIHLFEFYHRIVGMGTFCSDQHVDKYLKWRLVNGQYVYSLMSYEAY